MANQNQSKNSFLGILLSLLGVILSFFLIREYYGTAGDFISSLCTVTSVENGCDKVAKSDYSGIRNFPFFGDIPVALFGFVFYGLMLILSFFTYKYEGEVERKKSYFSLMLVLLTLALVIDLILLFISVFVIGTICPLCAGTYAITIGLLYVSWSGLKSIEETQESMMETIKKYSGKSFSTDLLNYLIIIVFFLACGIGGGRYSTNPGSTNMGSMNDGTLIQRKIKTYESAPTVTLDLNGVAFSGDPKAPITIVKYADFNCGHCMHASHILKEILAEYSGMVKVYYKNFPLDGNCNRLVTRKTPDASSCLAASAAICADKQKQFRPVYELLYEDNEKGVRHSPTSILEIAKKSRLNTAEFNTCMSSSEVLAQIGREVDEAEVLNIQSTPSVYVNNRALEPGTPDIIFLRALIDHITKKL